MYRIISTDNHLEWKKIISLCKEECIFLDLKYIKTFEEEKLVKGKLFFYKNKKKYFALPFLISSLKKYGYRNFEKFFDIETPYGYGGFISNTKDVKFLNKAIMSFNLYAKNNKVIASFLRFNPFLMNQTIQKTKINFYYNRRIVYLDLNNSLKEIYKNNYSSNHRNMIRKARKLYTVKLGDKKKDFNKLVQLYLKNMKAINADQFYFFNKDFFEGLFFNLKNNLIILSAVKKKSKETTAAVLILFDKNTGYYFLSGKNKKVDDNSSTNFLLHKAGIFLKKKNIKFFNLGGGNSDDQNDPLFKFKKKISKKTKSFFIGKMIHNKKIYDQLIKIWSKNYPYSNNKKFLKYRYEN